MSRGFTYALEFLVHFEDVMLADCCRVLRWIREARPESLRPIEEHTGRPLSYENCENLDAFILWTHVQLSSLNDSGGEVICDEEYRSWPSSVREFYLHVGRQLFGDADNDEDKR